MTNFNRFIVCLLVAFVCFKKVKCQNVGAYFDNRNYFYAFDDGTTKLLETMPIQSYKVGGNCIGYVDNSDGFKVYYKGEIIPLLENRPQYYFATDNMLVYYANQALMVFDNGKQTTLTYYASSYNVGDSLVGFVDQNNSSFNIYSQGYIKKIADNIDGKYISSFKAGDNVFAYTNNVNHLKVFYLFQLFDVENNLPNSYEAGNNTVAYVDGYSQNLKVFYQGHVIVLEKFPPKSYKVSDDIVSYVDNNGYFKIFYAGKTYTISEFEPNYYTTEDNLVVYGDDNYFNVFYKGIKTVLERYIPKNYQVDFNGIAYIDTYGYLKFFYDGKFQHVCDEKKNSFTLTRNALMFNHGLNEISFFLDGNVVNCTY